MGNRFWGVCCALVISVTGAQASQQQNRTSDAPAVKGELVIKLRSAYVDANASTLQKILRVERIEPVTTDGEIRLVRFSKASAKSALMQSLKARADIVELVEPNFIYTTSGIPDDPNIESQWGMINTGQAINGTPGTPGIDIAAEAAWDIETGSEEIIVGVIDTGIDYNHEDLAPNMWVNTLEQNGTPGVDDDQNGYVDDVHGYDFFNNKPNGRDDHGHGTHCAGVIGGVGANGVGVVGVNWKVRLMALKFLSASGSGSLSDAIRALEYAVKMRVHLTSNSWGGGGFSAILEGAIRKAKNAGQLFVAAAGNYTNDNDAKPFYPANYKVDNVVSVAALNNKGGLAYFSNFGKTSVHVAAPGESVYSTYLNGTYKFLSGTSMAAPHVAGLAALVLARDESLSVTALKTRLIETSRPLSSLQGKVVSEGIINAYSAVSNIRSR